MKNEKPIVSRNVLLMVRKLVDVVDLVRELLNNRAILESEGLDSFKVFPCHVPSSCMCYVASDMPLPTLANGILKTPKHTHKTMQSSTQAVVDRVPLYFCGSIRGGIQDVEFYKLIIK